MLKVVGIRFKKAGKIYYFDPVDTGVEVGDHVIVETVRGLEYGTVVIGARDVEENKLVSQLKPVMRKATEQDALKVQENKVREKEAFNICLRKIAKHGLPMRLIDVEFTFETWNLLLTLTRLFFILRRTGVSISVSLLRIWRPYSVPVLSCARLAYVTKRKCWAASAAAAGLCAALPFSAILSRYPSGWPKTRTCR